MMDFVTFITPSSSLATYLFKSGYTTYEIETIDGNRCYRFTIAKELAHKFKKDRDNWQR